MATNCKAIPITVLLLVVVLQLFLLQHTAESAAIGEHGSKKPTSGIRKMDLTQTKPKEGHTFASFEVEGDDGGDDLPPPIIAPTYSCINPQCQFLPSGELVCICN